MNTITSLDQLLELMQSNAPSIEDDWDNLPVFGGPPPDSTLGIWSWDATRLIVGTCPDDVRIVSRTEI